MKKSVKTIVDIANICCVSKSTVSRALNNSPLISEETRERIQKVAREHNFQINVPARNLSLKQSRTIAFVTHTHYSNKEFSVEDLFFLEVLGGVSKGASVNQYDLLMAYVNPRDPDWPRQYLDTGRADGFILMTSTRKQSHIKSLVEMGAPFIVWGVPQPRYSYCSVMGDNRNGGRLATQRLLDLGRRKIAFLGGPAEEHEVQMRFEGYQEVLMTAGQEVDPKRVVYGEFCEMAGTREMQQLLEQDPEIDAVFANSDLMAISAMKVIKESGRRIPDDIAVIGYDNIAISQYSCPALTTVNQNISRMGRLLAQNLIDYLQTGMVTNVTMPVELLIRESA